MRLTLLQPMTTRRCGYSDERGLPILKGVPGRTIGCRGMTRCQKSMGGPERPCGYQQIVGVERIWGRESVRSSKSRLISQFNDKKTQIWSSQPSLEIGSPIEIGGHNTSASTYVPLPLSSDIHRQSIEVTGRSGTDDGCDICAYERASPADVAAENEEEEEDDTIPVAPTATIAAVPCS